MSNGSANDDPAQQHRQPWVRLFGHIGEKGFQAGSLLGTAVVAPISYYRQRNVNAALSAAGVTALTLTGVAGLLGVAALYKEPLDRIEDRVYRLYYNEGQNRVDVFCTVAQASGLVMGLVGRKSGLELVGAMAVGSTLGLLAHAATAPAKKEPAAQKAGLAKRVQDSMDKMN